MNLCHCRGELDVFTTQFGQTMTECRRCGALACVRRITPGQLELMEAPATVVVVTAVQDREIAIPGLCLTLDCENPVKGRTRRCPDCRAVVAAASKRRYYERVMKPDRRKLACHQIAARRRAWQTRRARRAA